MSEEQKNQFDQTTMGVGIALGAGVGVALGTALGNQAMGIPIGISLGAAYVLVMQEIKRKKRD
jgi:predicted MFS family arabinose efflux permease